MRRSAARLRNAKPPESAHTSTIDWGPRTMFSEETQTQQPFVVITCTI